MRDQGDLDQAGDTEEREECTESRRRSRIYRLGDDWMIREKGESKIMFKLLMWENELQKAWYLSPVGLL